MGLARGGGRAIIRDDLAAGGETMAKSGTKKVRGGRRPVRDLGVKAATGVKGGAKTSLLMQACATGEHLKEVTIQR